MKKFLYFIFICSLCVGFAACGGDDDDDNDEFVWNGDWNDPNDPNYKGYYNPIEGDWINVDKLTHRLIFDKKFVYSGASYKESTGKWEISVTADKYTINNTAFKERGQISEYQKKTEGGVEYLYLRYLNSEWHKYKRYTE